LSTALVTADQELVVPATSGCSLAARNTSASIRHVVPLPRDPITSTEPGRLLPNAALPRQVATASRADAAQVDNTALPDDM
jgi:hypothetical protein